MSKRSPILAIVSNQRVQPFSHQGKLAGIGQRRNFKALGKAM